MRLHAVLEKAQKIMLNMDKCELTRHTVRFLGHVISADGVKPDPEKTRAVQEMDAPKNVPGVFGHGQSAGPLLA